MYINFLLATAWLAQPPSSVCNTPMLACTNTDCKARKWHKVRFDWLALSIWAYFGSSAAGMFKHANRQLVILTGASSTHALKLMRIPIQIIISRLHQLGRPIVRLLVERPHYRRPFPPRYSQRLRRLHCDRAAQLQYLRHESATWLLLRRNCRQGCLAILALLGFDPNYSHSHMLLRYPVLVVGAGG